MKYDIIIIGGGPAGLSLARMLASIDLKIAVIEKQDKKALANPAYDGREIALNHHSFELLEKYGILDFIPKKDISLIRDAKVLNGDSDYALHFDHKKSGKDNIGFMVANQAIRKAAFEAAASCKNIDFITGAEVVALKTDKTRGTVTFNDGKKAEAALIIAADSRFSSARKMIGIPTAMTDFGRTCIVCTMKIKKTHDNTAHEYFHYDRTLAILPLNDNEVSVVITLGSDQAPDLMKMNDADFVQDIDTRTNGQFGTTALTSKKFTYPLVATFAERFYGSRFALIGDAAVGMHPVTAHGFNMGLGGAHTLKTEIENSLKLGFDLGNETALRNYSEKHVQTCRPIYLGTNALVKLYTANSSVAKFIRSSLLKIGNRLAPAKHLILKQLTDSHS